MEMNWLYEGPAALGISAAKAALMYAVVLALTRIGGVRTLAKTSTFDFVVTLSIGAVLAGAILDETPSIARAAVGIGVLFSLQACVSLSRRAWGQARWLVDNTPILIVARGRLIDENVRRARLTKLDVGAALRQSGVPSLEEASAVVLEKTGSFSVYSCPFEELSEEIFKDVAGRDALFPTATLSSSAAS